MELQAWNCSEKSIKSLIKENAKQLYFHLIMLRADRKVFGVSWVNSSRVRNNTNKSILVDTADDRLSELDVRHWWSYTVEPTAAFSMRLHHNSLQLKVYRNEP